MSLFYAPSPSQTAEQEFDQRHLRTLPQHSVEAELYKDSQALGAYIDSLFEGFQVPVSTSQWMIFLAGAEPDPGELSGWREPREILILQELIPENDTFWVPYTRIISVERKQGTPMLIEEVGINHVGEAQYHLSMAPTDDDLMAKKPATGAVLFRAEEDGTLFMWNKRVNTPVLALKWRNNAQRTRPYGFADEPVDWRYALTKAQELVGAVENLLPVYQSGGVES